MCFVCLNAVSTCEHRRRKKVFNTVRVVLRGHSTGREKYAGYWGTIIIVNVSQTIAADEQLLLL